MRSSLSQASVAAHCCAATRRRGAVSAASNRAACCRASQRTCRHHLRTVYRPAERHGGPSRSQPHARPLTGRAAHERSLRQPGSLADIVRYGAGASSRALRPSCERVARSCDGHEPLRGAASATRVRAQARAPRGHHRHVSGRVSCVSIKAPATSPDCPTAAAPCCPRRRRAHRCCPPPCAHAHARRRRSTNQPRQLRQRAARPAADPPQHRSTPQPSPPARSKAASEPREQRSGRLRRGMRTARQARAGWGMQRQAPAARRRKSPGAAQPRLARPCRCLQTASQRHAVQDAQTQAERAARRSLHGASSFAPAAAHAQPRQRGGRVARRHVAGRDDVHHAHAPAGRGSSSRLASSAKLTRAGGQPCQSPRAVWQPAAACTRQARLRDAGGVAEDRPTNSSAAVTSSCFAASSPWPPAPSAASQPALRRASLPGGGGRRRAARRRRVCRRQ